MANITGRKDVCMYVLAKIRGSSRFIDVDFSCCLHSHALLIYQKINSVAITLRFHTKISEIDWTTR